MTSFIATGCYHGYVIIPTGVSRHTFIGIGIPFVAAIDPVAAIIARAILFIDFATSALSNHLSKKTKKVIFTSVTNESAIN